MNQPPMTPRTLGRTLFETLFTNPKTVGPLALVLLVAISTLPSLGVLAGFAFLILALLLGIRQGSFAEIGFRKPPSWARTIFLGLLIGVGVQILFSVVVDPLLGRLTGAPVDVSALDGMRGHLGNYLLMLAVGWLVGGFLEEMLFRGYLVKRLGLVLGRGPVGLGVAVVLPGVAFGLAHAYQGVAGMVSTGLIGVILGAAFVWSRDLLWLPILAHGFMNALGVTLIYTNGDKLLSRVLFP